MARTITNFEDILQKIEWFYRTGPQNEVAVSTRLRVSRNLSDFPFPANLKVSDKIEVKEKIINAFRNLTLNDDFLILYVNEMSAIEQHILSERFIISRDFLENRQKIAILNAAGDLCGMINEKDHLKITAIKTGLALKEAFIHINELDNHLEKKLDFAVSLEWGYLSNFLHDTGTALKASVLLHLPALAMTSQIDEVLKTVARKGITVTPFLKGKKTAQPDTLYQFSNTLRIGKSEKEIVENLEKSVQSLIDLEMKIRDKLFTENKTELEDKLLRAVGILRYCKSIAFREAVNLLSLVRLGVALGTIKGISLETVTGLFFIIQKAHILKILESLNRKMQKNLVDYLRSQLIQDFLSNNFDGGK
ncbi:MAG: hypothetical protein JW969_00900 [Spirochaetales bacterium]|nr:hypothetical protein [Spirochaetales bacterium]